MHQPFPSSGSRRLRQRQRNRCQARRPLALRRARRSRPSRRSRPRPTSGGDTAARWDLIGNAALEAARRADIAGNKGLAETYRAKSAEAFGNSKMIREGLIGAQRKQAETQVEQEKGIFDEGRKGYASGQDIQL